jgi:hypothetical protein
MPRHDRYRAGVAAADNGLSVEYNRKGSVSRLNRHDLPARFVLADFFEPSSAILLCLPARRQAQILPFTRKNLPSSTSRFRDAPLYERSP